MPASRASAFVDEGSLVAVVRDPSDGFVARRSAAGTWRAAPELTMEAVAELDELSDPRSVDALLKAARTSVSVAL